jgi:hypothetical protein
LPSPRRIHQRESAQRKKKKKKRKKRSRKREPEAAEEDTGENPIEAGENIDLPKGTVAVEERRGAETETGGESEKTAVRSLRQIQVEKESGAPRDHLSHRVLHLNDVIPVIGDRENLGTRPQVDLEVAGGENYPEVITPGGQNRPTRGWSKEESRSCTTGGEIVAVEAKSNASKARGLEETCSCAASAEEACETRGWRGKRRRGRKEGEKF